MQIRELLHLVYTKVIQRDYYAVPGDIVGRTRKKGERLLTCVYKVDAFKGQPGRSGIYLPTQP